MLRLDVIVPGPLTPSQVSRSARIWAEAALLEGGWARDVAVVVGSDGRIESVMSGAERRGATVAVPVLLPAVCNLHSHTFQRAMAGRTEARGPAGADSFWTWRESMYSFLETLTPDDIEAVATLAFVEMLESGYAAVGEFHYLHHAPGGKPYDRPAEMAERIASAAEATGIGLTLLPAYYAQGGCDGRPLAGGQLRFGNDLDGFARIVEGAREAVTGLPDALVGIAPHSLRAVSSDDLARLTTVFPNAPTHIHAAEQTAEVDEVLAHLGARPVEWLLDHAPLNARWCVVHATHMPAEERSRLARSGAVAGLCPVTEANLGDGVFEAAAYGAEGGSWGVGTDSNVRVSLVDELRTLEYGQRLRDGMRAVMADSKRSTGRRLYDDALTGGSRALGRASGAIRTGLWADLVAIDLGRSDLHGLMGDGLLDGWIFAARESPVTDVWSAGRHVVQEGRHVARLKSY